MSDGVHIVPADEGDAEEKALRDALTDVQEPTPEAEPTQAESKSEPAKDKEQEQQKSDNSEPEAEVRRNSAGQEIDEKGRFKAKVETEPVKPLTEGQPEDGQHKEGTQPTPPPTNKDEARLARQWQKTQAEKLEVRNALAEVRQLREQLQQQLQRPQTQGQFDSKRLWLAAEDFDRQASALFAQGDIEQGNAKLQLARETRQYAQQEAQKENYQAQQIQSQNFERTWQQNAEVIIQQHPTLGDPNSRDAQDMMEVLEDLPILGHIPNGFALAAEWLSNKRQAASYSELRAKYDQLEKENKELRSKTAISGGGVTPKLGQVNPEDMSLDEQEAHLRAQLDTSSFSLY